jgi:hypothetical protein
LKLCEKIISKVTSQIDFEWKKFLSPDKLNELARRCGFSKRNSKKNKLSGATFFDLIVMNDDSLCSQSLNQLCEEMSLRNDIDIKSSSLNARFNATAVTFLKSVLQHVTKSQIDNTFKAVKTPFKRILVKDSTCFSSITAIWPQPILVAVDQHQKHQYVSNLNMSYYLVIL